MFLKIYQNTYLLAFEFLNLNKTNVMRLTKSIASKLIVQNSTLDAYLIQLKLNETKRKRENYEETIIDKLISKK